MSSSGLSKKGVVRGWIQGYRTGKSAKQNERLSEKLKCGDLIIDVPGSGGQCRNAMEIMKFCPIYPSPILAANKMRTSAADFIDWYNRKPHHHGLVLFTPSVVHFRQADDIPQKR